LSTVVQERFPDLRLRPFFHFFGGKWRDAVKNYPAPQYDTVVEPFAGAAGYSVRYASRRIVLCEIDPVIFSVWNYLQSVTPSEVLSLPDVPMDGSVDDLKVCQEAKWLIGFWVNSGVTSPRKTPGSWMRSLINPGAFWGDRVRTTIATQVGSIRHWQILNCSYVDCPVPLNKATWFIDPPYEREGKHYRYGSKLIDYAALGAWCRSRPGQVIVCENSGATWLPFRHLANIKTARKNRRSNEAIWLSDEQR